MDSVINSLRKFWKSEAFIKTNKKMKALSWVSKVNNLLIKSLTDLDLVRILLRDWDLSEGKYIYFKNLTSQGRQITSTVN